MKKLENSPLYRGFWGVQIAKHRKTAQITPFYPPERAWGFHGRWCRSVEPEGMDRIQDTLILYYIIYIHASILYISMHHISTGFQEGRFLNGRAARNSLSLPEIGNIGLLCMKHPYFRGKTSVLLPKEVRCFWTSGTFSSSESRSNACIDYAERRKRRRSQPMLLLP